MKNLFTSLKMYLPDGVILEILSSANDTDIKTLCRVNKQFSRMCSDPRIYKRILELRNKQREEVDRLVEKLRPRWVQYPYYIREILSESELTEYNFLLWELIIKFVKQHPEAHDQLRQLFGDLTRGKIRDILYNWLAEKKDKRDDGIWAFTILASVNEATRYRYRDEIKNLNPEAIKQLLLLDYKYVKSIHDVASRDRFAS